MEERQKSQIKEKSVNTKANIQHLQLPLFGSASELSFQVFQKCRGNMQSIQQWEALSVNQVAK